MNFTVESIPDTFSDSESTLTVGIFAAAITLSIITLFTIVGNVLVILSVFTYKPLKTVQNMYIVSLAVSDIAVSVCVMPLNIAYIVIGKWIFGLMLCKMWLTSDVLCCTASILNLCAIALDRYWAIHDPINYAQKRTMNRTLFKIALVWILSLIISVPPLLGWNDWSEDFTEDTPCTLTKEKGYLIYSSNGSFFIPLVIMTVVYFKIFLATKQRLRERASQSAANMGKMLKTPAVSVTTSSREIGTTSTFVTSDGDPGDPRFTDECSSEESETKSSAQPTTVRATPATTPGTGQPESFVNQLWEQKQKISLSRERRAARVLGIVMGVFVACWLPFFLMYLTPFCESCNIPPTIEMAITWLGYTNSALNPIIYTIFNLDFRKAFKKYLTCS